MFLGSASFDIATCSSNPTGWTAMNQVLGGDEKAKGSLTLLVRPYSDFSVKVMNSIKLRNADGYEPNHHEPDFEIEECWVIALLDMLNGNLLSKC